MIPKSGKDHCFPQSYRQINLLSNAVKIIEHLMFIRFRAELELLKVISDEKFGFRESLDSTGITAAVFLDILDIEAALDTVGMTDWC